MIESTLSLSTDAELDELTALVGPDNLLRGDAFFKIYKSNVTEFEAPELIAVVTPESVSQVQDLVVWAGRRQVSLYPLSTGYNWGLGSKLPVQGGTIIVDLKKLNRIRHIDEHFRYAIIEPGVTHEELAHYLRTHHPGFLCSVTGSSPQTSYIGNMLERGSTFQAHKADESRGFEVVLGTGEILRTGFWNEPTGERTVHHYRHGIGPGLTDLFFQSNLGIVTAAVINLHRRPAASLVLWAHVEDNKLEPFLDAYQQCYAHGHLRFTTHIGNEKRMKITFSGQIAGSSLWTAMVWVTGASQAELDLHVAAIERLLAPVTRSMEFVTEDQSKSLDATREKMYALHQGVPSEVFLRAMHQSHNNSSYTPKSDIDSGDIGMMCCLPMVPFSGADGIEVVETLKEVGSRYGLEVAMTFNPMNDLYMEAVINIYFTRSNQDETERAHACNEALHDALYERGYRFYRYDTRQMTRRIDGQSTQWRTVKAIKTALDPMGILAPGRYNLL